MERVKPVLLFLILVPVFGMAQPTKDTWDNLRRLASGQQIRIVLNGAKSYSGQFESVSNDGLTVRTGAGEQPFERQNVLRVSTKGESHRLRNSLLDLGVGVGVGAAIAAGGTSNDSEARAIVMPIGVLVGAGAGAGGGAAIPTRGWYDVYGAR